MSNSLFTIGHSNLSIEAFMALLQQHEITAVADVRSHPYSRRFPQFNQRELKASLQEMGISYVFLGQELGARTDDRSCYVNGKALYEKIAATALFAEGIQRVLKGLTQYRIALMCAEKDPITCHRTILLCRHLKAFDLEINHILNDGKLESHQELEDRLLGLFGLLPPLASQPIQLSLFSDLSMTETVARSRTDCLAEAYQKQGDKIAYIEKQ
jgi:uncharacterized protein (DUF488 family)